MIVKFGKMEWVVIGDYEEQSFWVATFISWNCVVVTRVYSLCDKALSSRVVIFVVFWCVCYISINVFEYHFAIKTNSVDYNKILKS